MTMKKQMESQGDNIIAGSDPSKLYPIGFKYALKDTIYTVIKRFYEDNTEIRRLQTSEGILEDVTTDTIRKDLKSDGATIIDKKNEEH